jgi:Holliday junction DNA helicase RuvB
MTPGPPRRGAEVGPFPPYDEAERDTTYGGAGRDTTYGGAGRAGEPGYDAGERGEPGSGDEYGDGSYDATARVVDPTLEGSFDADDERRVEAALRPKRLAEIAGQTRVREQLGLVLEAARRRGTPPDHMLLSGPPGLGKTTLAMIVAAELEAPIRVTSGPAIQHAGDLASILSSLTEGEVLFLDEIHRMSRAAEEMLYLAMEDFRVDIVVGKGPGATAIPLELAPFTVVAATTRAGLLPAPLRDRFGFTGHLDYYEVDDLVAIILRSARLLGVATDEAGVSEIARRSRGTPRIANRLLRRVRDWAQVHGQDVVDRDAAMAALALFDVDSAGLDRLDRAVLDALCRRFAGGPVGLTTLAVAVGEEPDTVETVAEPYLVREGFMIRTPRGRAASAAAWAHLGLAAPPGAPGAPGGAGGGAWAGTSGGAAPSAPSAGGGLPGLRQDELPWGGTTGRF